MSKHFITADDVRLLAEAGERELMLRQHTILTDAAVDAARQFDVRLVEGSTYSASKSLPAPVLAGRQPQDQGGG